MIWHIVADRRASYQSKHIRDWAAQLNATYEPRGTNAAAVAFRAMGADAVPTLRSLLHAQDPVSEKVLLKLVRFLPVRLRVYLIRKFQPGRAMEYRLGAVRALGVIGPDARPALPDLLGILSEPDGRIRWTTAQTLSLLGPEAITSLLALTTNTDWNMRHVAVYALGEAHTNAMPAVPALIRCSFDTNENIRASALYSLGRVGFAGLPQALAIAATNTDPQMQNAAFRSLVVLRPPPGRMLASQSMIATNAPEIRRMALLTLWYTRQTNDYALKLYRASLSDEEASVREVAQRILDRFSSTNRSLNLAP